MDVQDYIDLRLVHEIHRSMRQSFRGCRRRWDWIFHGHYYPRTTAKPLEFGVAYHVGMEVFYNPDTWNWDLSVRTSLAIKAFVDKCDQQKKKALEVLDIPYLDSEVEADYQERVKLGKGMLYYYCTRVSPEQDKGWKPVRVEVEFLVEIPHPETKETIWCKCNACWKLWTDKFSLSVDPATDLGDRRLWQGLPVVYGGRLDVLAQDENDDLWIIDWKTARALPKQFAFLDIDDQVGSYPWALRKCLGLNVRGFVYHAQRKGFPQPPQRNRVRRLGCIFSVNKNQEVDYDTYLLTVQKEDAEAFQAGYYNDMLTFLKNEGAVYFTRHQIHKTDDELEEIERNLGLEVLDMIDPNLRIYPSPGRFGCDFCAFQTPCIEKNTRGDYEYALETGYEKRPHYWVKQEPSTESKGGE